MAAKLKKFNADLTEVQPTKEAGKGFINNQEFKDKLREYLDYRKAEVEAGREIPQVTNYLGNAFRMIAEALSKKPYFIGYSYREEMVGDAIINCIQYIDKFDPERGTSAFAYFTQICYYAIVRRIKAEQKQTYVKASIVQNLGTLFDELVVGEHDNSEDFTNTMADILKLQTIEIPVEEKKSKKKETASVFVEDDLIVNDELMELIDETDILE